MSDDVVFQTSVTATPPNATRVATDLIASRHYQLVKLAYGDDGTAYLLGPGTPMPIGTLPGGTVVLGGTAQMLGTFQPLAGSVHVANVLFGTVQVHGTAQVLGTVQPLAGSVHLASRLPGTVDLGTVAGTVSILGTTQPLDGSVHVANTLVIASGTVSLQTGGTVHVGSVQRIAGTVEMLGTVQPLAGSVHLASRLPGTVDVGTVAGTVSVLGTMQPLAGWVHVANTISGTVQVHGTVPVGTVAGTVSILGTVQGLAGSAHLATNLAGGTVVAVGSAVHGAAADARPLLMAAFGSSGTQAAVDDGDSVRLWADLNGRLQVRGTIDSLLGTVSLNTGGTTHIGSVQRVAGTVETLGTTQPLAGSVHLASRLPGTVDIGTIAGTVSIGTVAGTVRIGAIAGTIPGGTIIAQAGGFGSYLGSAFTAAVSFGTLIAPPAQGTRWRLFDVTINASAGGSALFTEAATGAAGTTVFGPLFFAGSGGWQFNSSRGLLARGTAQGLYFSNSAGTMPVTVNYALES